LDRLFEGLHHSPVTRSRDGVVAGVAAGVAERFGVSPLVVRVILLALVFLGAGVPLYLLAWLVLPDGQGRVRLESAIREGQLSSVVLLVLTAIALFATVFGGTWVPGLGGLLVLLVLAGVAAFAVSTGWSSGRRDREVQGHTPPPPAVPDGPQDAPRR
jgi:phage shock protein PspC (stress-responsive transcriptional regulator)